MSRNVLRLYSKVRAQLKPRLQSLAGATGEPMDKLLAAAHLGKVVDLIHDTGYLRTVEP